MNNTLMEYLYQATSRLSEEALKILDTLKNNKDISFNKEDLSLHSNIKRSTLDKGVLELYVLGLVDVNTEGKSRMCRVTKLGLEVRI